MVKWCVKDFLSQYSSRSTIANYKGAFRRRLGDIVKLAVTLGYLELIAFNGYYNELNDEQVGRLKSNTGPYPNIFRVTKKGLDYLKNNKNS
jgi:hypothetical protein